MTERVLFVEIDQPFCTRTYGTAPCTAVLGTTGANKCYNTRKTCQSPANYEADSYAQLTGASGAYVSSSGAGVVSAINTAGGFTIIAQLEMDLWHPFGDQVIASKSNATAAQSAFRFIVTSVPKLRIEMQGIGGAGAVLAQADSTVNLSITDATKKWVKVTVRFNVAGNIEVKFFTSDDGITWTQLGATIGGASNINTLNDGSAPLEIGSNTGGTLNLWAGKVYLVDVQAGADLGNTKARFLASEGKVSGAAQVLSSLTGETWTVNGAASLVMGYYTIRLARRQDGLHKLYDAIPSIVGDSVAPAAINLGGMDRSVSALGAREVVTLKVENHLFADVGLDKYRLERLSGAASSPSVPFAPYKQGTFWGKFLARNPYAPGYPLRTYYGEYGQALSAMVVRNYIIDRIDGPTDGLVAIVAKDKFARLEKSKAVAPRASKGELSADMTGSPGSFTLNPAGIGAEYDAAGHVAIGDEAIQYTRVGDVCTVVARGALNTVQADHKAEDLVQQVLSYATQKAHVVARDLLLRFGATSYTEIDAGAWETAAVALTELYTARIAKPTPVMDLVGELAEQAGFTVRPNLTTGRIDFVALRAANPVATIDDSAWLVKDTFKPKRRIDKRASQVWIYYAQLSPVVDLQEKRNYRSRVVRVDLESEGPQQYGQPAIREVFSRWIPQFGRTLAQNVGDRLITMFRDGAVETEFSLHADRDSSLNLADYVTLATADLESDVGLPAPSLHAVISKERADAEIGIKTQSVFFNTNVGDPNNRTIYIENDANDLNLRTIHDSLYAAPTGAETVNFVVVSGVKIGSSSAATPAMDVGTWPGGNTLTLTNGGRIQGKGGVGGNGGVGTVTAGGAGAAGGTALKTARAISVTNNSEIWGGAGGGGGGAGYNATFNVSVAQAGGGGGGGGAGKADSSGGSGSSGGFGTQTPGATGSNGTTAAGGGGGAGGQAVNAGGSAVANGGAGGAGGGPGLAGSAGGNGSLGAGSSGANGTPGAGGAAGKYIDGNAFVTWLVNGDRRGSVA
jgi:hypothetical protein